LIERYFTTNALVLASCSSIKEGVDAIGKYKPEIVFLDIQMPGIDGLTFAEQVLQANLKSHIIFVTAYHQYAIKAFEYNALDYLLKPVRPERFLKTLQRIMDKPLRNEVHSTVALQQNCQIHCFGELEVIGPNGQVQ
jgi:two-component SAPR family response regulator